MPLIDCSKLPEKDERDKLSKQGLIDYSLLPEQIKEEKSIWGFAGNIGRGIAELRHIPKGVGQLIASGVATIADPGHLKEQAAGAEHFPHLGDIGKSMAGHYGEYGKDPLGKAYRDPVGVGLDILGLVAGGATVVGKIGALSKAGKVGSIGKTGRAGVRVEHGVKKIQKGLGQQPEMPLLEYDPTGTARRAFVPHAAQEKLMAVKAKGEKRPIKSIQEHTTDLEAKRKRFEKTKPVEPEPEIPERTAKLFRDLKTGIKEIDEIGGTPKGEIKPRPVSRETVKPTRLKSETGGTKITQTDITQVSNNLEKLNIWNKYAGTPFYNALMKAGREGVRIPFTDKRIPIVPERVQRWFVENYGERAEFMKAANEELTRAGISVEGGVAWAKKGQKVVAETGKEKMLKALTAKERTGASTLRGTELYKDAKYIEDTLSDLWKQVKELGLSESEFFEGRYLPKISDKSVLSKIAYFKRHKFTGRLKPRGEFRTFNKSFWEKDKQKYLDKDWEVSKDMGTKIQIRKFVPYGDIQDPYVLFAKGVADLEHDIALARIIKNVAKNPKWVSQTELEGWSKLRSINPKLEKVAGIRDLYIHPDIASTLNEMILIKSPMRKFFDESISLWKLGKTVWSSATHVRNVVSNLILNDLGGLSPVRRFDIYARAIREKGLGSKSKYWTDAKGGGLFGKTFYDAEIKQMMGNVLDSKSMMGVVKKLTSGKYNPAKLYQFEEEWCKFAKFIHNRQKGLSVADAVSDAQKWIFDYSNVSPFVSLARRTVAPFITFQAKAFPRIVETAIKHPLRIGKYVAAYYAWEKYAKTMLGLSDREYENVRNNAPDYIKKGGQWVLLSERDKNGNFQFFNMTYFLPWGDMVGGGVSTGVSWLPGPVEQVVIPSNPFVRLPFEIKENKSFFTGRKIRQPEESYLKAGLKYATDVALPPIAGYQGRELVKTTFQKGKTYFGEDIPRTKAVKSLVGVRTKSIDIKREKKFKKIDIRKQVQELQSRMMSIRRNKSLSSAEKLKKISELERQRKQLKKEYDEIK